MKFLLPLALMFILLSGCPSVPADTGFQIGETITLPMKESTSIKSENITLLFTKVESDNRCPKGVNCFTAGKAVINIDVAVGDAVTPVQLEAKGLCQKEDGSCGTEAIAQGYKIKLYQLYPYPEEGGNKNETKHVAKIMVTK